MRLSDMAVVVAWLLPLASSQFVPPAAILQAGYPAGFRAFIPDFPGCEMFAFHAKVNSPFVGDEAGTFSQEILRPHRGFWVFQDLSAILNPGDILHYWTLVVKDGVGFPQRNQSWTVPDPDESVDLLSPVTLKPPPRPRPNPEKMVEAEPTTPTEEETTPPMETSPTDDATTPSSETDPTEMSTSSPSPTTTTPTTPQTSPTTEPTTTPKPTTPKKTTPAPKPTTTTTKKPPTTTTKPKSTKPKKSTPLPNPLLEEEDVEELTTPALPFDKPISGEFPQEPPSLFPFPGPSLFPRPFKPMMPPTGPGFEICSNPWNFEEQPGETRTQRLERQVAKLQCQLAFFQRGYTQLGNTVENELTDMKKLIYGMVGRMARLESVIRSAAFG